MKRRNLWALTAAMAVAMPAVQAADHAESLQVVASPGGDIADVYAFLDPNDNTKAIIAFDVHGFIVPGENGNISAFESDVLFRFEIENTGDARIDKTVEVTFDRQTSRSAPQMAHISIPGLRRGEVVRFDAPTTVGSPTSPTAPTPTVTTDSRSGVSFFAGQREDPFFFDIPAFNRFVSSISTGQPDPSLLSRGRDTFAGYNVQMITLRIPVELLKGSAGNVVGVGGTTLRSRLVELLDKDVLDPSTRALAFSNPFLEQIDRMGVPVINTVAIPFPRKDKYNSSNSRDDAAGVFANDIVASLRSLGTNDTNIGLLAAVAVTRGDLLRLDTSIPNKGLQGGTSVGASFPNGRRPTDDVIDTVLAIVSNGGITAGDNVNGNDAIFANAFPFFAAPNQPRAAGIIDDNTRN